MINAVQDLNMSTGDKKDFHNIAFYRFIIDSLPTAVLTVNADLEITGFNPWAEKITGYSKKEALGNYCGEILQGGMCLANCPLKTVLNGHKPVALIETTIVNKWGGNDSGQDKFGRVV
jgi:PAS domain-containing protein